MLELKMLFQSFYTWIVVFNSLIASNFLKFFAFVNYVLLIKKNFSKFYSFSILYGFFCILLMY
jgi:hypothetical protein